MRLYITVWVGEGNTSFQSKLVDVEEHFKDKTIEQVQEITDTLAFRLKDILDGAKKETRSKD